MKVAIVGGGVLGLTLAYRLAGMGHRVEILEAAPGIGGLAGPQDYGDFVWDRFYHCILPQDTSLIAFLEELGLGADLRWSRTGTGYYARGQFIPMSNNGDFLRFPLLSLWDKFRLGVGVVWARRIADPDALYAVTAEEWLSRICGRKAYSVFWQPLLKAKFGPFHDQVAAVFIHATLVRLFGARSASAGKESLGYVRGGYRQILDRIQARLTEKGVTIRTGARVKSIEPITPERSCRVSWGEEGKEFDEKYDQVFFTGPTRAARSLEGKGIESHLEAVEKSHPTGTTYLGVACLVMTLDRPLTPYYVLNIGEPSVELTGLIEMTNLVDRESETKGLSLVYLPRYMASDSSGFDESDDSLRASMIDRGFKRLFPDFDPRSVRYSGVHRARLVQPLPLVRQGSGDSGSAPIRIEQPFQVLNTSMLRCATLNNNEVVAFVDRTVEGNQDLLK